jgi:hypothetical protein
VTGEQQAIGRLQPDARVPVGEGRTDAGIDGERALDLEQRLDAVAQVLDAAEADDGAVVGLAVDGPVTRRMTGIGVLERHVEAPVDRDGGLGMGGGRG